MKLSKLALAAAVSLSTLASQADAQSLKKRDDFFWLGEPPRQLDRAGQNEIQDKK